jgi:serine protease AprX
MKTTKLNRGALSVALILFIFGALSFSSRSGAQKAPSAPTLDLNWQAKVDSTVLSKAVLGSTDFLIYMNQQADLSGARSLATKNEKGQYVYQRLTETANATQGTVKATLQQFGSQYKSFWISNTIYAKGGLTVLQAVASLPEVRAIYGPGKGELKLPPNDTSGSESAAASSTSTVALADPNPEPGLNITSAPLAWAMGIEGQGVIVAGADTGVRWTHTALKNQYRGWNGATASHDYNWKDAIHTGTWPADPANICNGGGTPGNPSPEPCDDDDLLGGGHGSHTVGSMLGDDGGTNRIGMAPQAQWVACRNMSRGVGAIPSYLECMEWFIAPTKVDGTVPDPTKAPHVINNSWGCVEGCPPEPNPLRDTLQASRDAGIVYVASAGNDGDANLTGIGPHILVCNSVYHPLARYPESFTIGSTTHNTDLVSRFSSRGPAAADPENPESPLYTKPNVTAPGSNIRSALRGSDSEYGALSGTSMAGPHAAGLVALVISANPRLGLTGDVDRIEDIIEQTAVKKTTAEGCGLDSPTQVPNNTYGWGRINALAAVVEALPPVANDDTATTQQNTPVTINVLANDEDIDSDPLSVTAASDPANGSATINPDNTITYTPDTGFAGQDTFTYTICAPEGCDTTSDTATVTVTVTAAGLTNYALSTNGGVATASSSHSSGLYPASATNNGDRIGNTWGTVNGGWNDGTRAAYPDDLEVAFSTAKTISEIRVFTLQNGWALAGEPTEATPCTGEGILDFEVQYWNGSAWVTVPSGAVTGNDSAMRVFTFPAISTTKIRVHVTNARNNWTRIVEVEAFGAAGQ